ncbi:MAG: hypothetical protein HY914_00230 [Desulfomonile tiedjei]|nr:hypothetical protein [Desulfomonile tiedjei]
MRSSLLLCLLLASMTMVHSVYGEPAQQPTSSPAVAPQPRVTPYVPGAAPYVSGAASNVAPAMQPERPYPTQPRAAQPEARFTGPDVPYYPYPPYHNPYYEEYARNNSMAESIDRLRNWSSDVWDRVSDVVTNRFYPTRPAAQGSSTAGERGLPAPTGYYRGDQPVQPAPTAPIPR